MWQEAAERVYRARFDPCDVTVTAVVGADGVAVVDTRCSPAEGRELKESLRTLTGAPIRWVVNTHAHFDHVWGNVEFVAPRLTPPARIWGHASVPAGSEFDLAAPVTKALLEQLRAEAAEDPGWAAARLDELEVAAPTELVEERAVIDLGDRALELLHLGRGHTAGDLWLRVDDADVLLAGDLVEQSGPPAYGPDSFPLEWAATLERALALMGPGTVVVPGHGEPVDADFVRRQRAAIDAVAREITRLHIAGVAVEAALDEGAWTLPRAGLGQAVRRGYEALIG
ncbi:MBL fold metallo-hydrolase [Actinospica durhamensis]|uniref:MBL fold metallo-hydrolase n=1 Tax=Actinospica durhamensis TaxID=1508375 RepID=A0A941ERR8_9ACTN|nr:MBL fold metallo-hydrolase [Actinospica durhamensis]MBR7837215.1 MBL fold metallo-hydrolase [Actinospica durhamensis]